MAEPKFEPISFGTVTQIHENIGIIEEPGEQGRIVFPLEEVQAQIEVGQVVQFRKLMLTEQHFAAQQIKLAK